MGYIGIPGNLPQVGKFIEENELAAPHIQTAYCYYCPSEKRANQSLNNKEFQIICFTSAFYYYTYIQDGLYKTVKTDHAQFIIYVNKDDNLLTYDHRLNHSLYCNQGKVIEWAQKCIKSYEPANI